MWDFYHDEAFHDRKIKTKADKINIYTDNASDIYVSVFWGNKTEDTVVILNNFSRFEEKYRRKFGLSENQELKGSINRKRNFTYGIRSFNKDCVDFYNDYFDVFDKDIVLCISMLSKTAFMISKVIKNILPYDFKFNLHSFTYIITKFLYNYRYNELMLKFFAENSKENSSELIKLLVEFLNQVIKKNTGVPRKRIENESLSEIKYLLEHLELRIVTTSQYSWDYRDVFQNFNLLLDERGIAQEKSNIILDREVKTYNAAIEVGNYTSVIEVESTSSDGIRIADIMSNFIGRMILALEDELKEADITDLKQIEKTDYSKKKLLHPNWFNVDERRYNLYRKINDFFINIMRRYNWTTQGYFYFDYSTILFALFQYYSVFKSFADFKKIKPEEHSERFNNYSCVMLEERYKEFYIN
ncbi:MAG TPA: hypothetical protein DCE48_06765 [Lachnospiraceae bacterium]|nr:hypothetical protein [Lachnospiraceae bacterium]